jgi:hypothetical protein
MITTLLHFFGIPTRAEVQALREDLAAAWRDRAPAGAAPHLPDARIVATVPESEKDRPRGRLFRLQSGQVGRYTKPRPPGWGFVLCAHRHLSGFRRFMDSTALLPAACLE